MRSSRALALLLPAGLALALVHSAAAQFASPQIVPAGGEGPRHLQLDDLDGDGDLDLLTSSHDGQIRWNENLGAGVFSAQEFVWIP